MMLKGMPDFSQVIQGADFMAFAPYEAGSQVTVVPTALKIAQTVVGNPAFVIELVRSANPFDGAAPHGFLYMTLELGALSDAMMTAIRSAGHPQPLTKAPFYQGFIRFFVKTDVFDETAVKNELAEAIPLDSGSVFKMPLMRKLSASAALVLKRALQGNVVLMEAYAQLELKGVAARLPMSIEFDPAEFIALIEKRGDENHCIALPTLFDYLKTNLQQLPIRFLKKDETIDNQLFIETLIDWLIHRFYTFVPAPVTNLVPHIQLKEKINHGKFIWDFSEPLLVSRMFDFRLDALSAAQQVVTDKGLESVFKETVIQNLNTGFLPLVVQHVFSMLPENVLKIGVKIAAPANAYRGSLLETVYLDPKKDSFIISLKFSPREQEKIYTYQTFVVLKDSSGTRELKSATIASKEPILRLGYNDFPIQFIPMEANLSLLKQVPLKIKWEWQELEQPRNMEFELTALKPTYTLALPKEGIVPSQVTVAATDKLSSKTLELKLDATTHLYIDRYSFPEFGAHAVHIECVFGEADKLMTFDFLPESQSETLQHITTLSFTPTQSQRTWTWFTDSMFQAGFRYRLHPNNGLGKWSAVQSPFLGTLQVGFTQNSKPPMDGVPFLKGDKDQGNIRYFKNNSDTANDYFIPLKPTATKSSNGDFSLSLMIFGSTGILQLGTEWSADTSILDTIKSNTGRRLIFAPIVLERADLVLVNDSKTSVLESSKTSAHAPYHAIFNASLDDAQQNLVIAALHQRKNVLQVQYYAARVVDTKAFVKIEGNISTAKRNLNPNATLSDCKEWLLKAIDDQILTKTIQSDELTPKIFLSSVEAEAIDKAANEVFRFIKDTTASIKAYSLTELSKTQAVELPFVVTTDIGDWFTGNEADQYIKNFATTLSN
jgi:hypothetical protein